MNNQEIVSKLWALCNVLRDDGITYHQYVTELTYILFLKMAKETDTEKEIPEQYRWDKLVKQDGINLKKFYKELLEHLGEVLDFGKHSYILSNPSLSKSKRNTISFCFASSLKNGIALKTLIRFGIFPAPLESMNLIFSFVTPILKLATSSFPSKNTIISYLLLKISSKIPNSP